MNEGDVQIGAELIEHVCDGETMLSCKRLAENHWVIELIVSACPTEAEHVELLHETTDVSAFQVGRLFERELATRRMNVRFR